MRRLHASHTHLYRGARLTADSPRRFRAGDALLIEFADLGLAEARVVEAAASRLLVDVAEYRTARGTRVPAKRWRLESSAGAGACWRVKERVERRALG